MLDTDANEHKAAQAKEDESVEWTRGDSQALSDAGSALTRLLTRAEELGVRRSKRIAQFLSTVDQKDIVVWPARDMREDEVAISDDMLLCLNALRWQRKALMELVPDGNRRLVNVVRAWRSARGSASDA